ncbi:carotenoid biosynthesis protein [Yinghuangia sp. YIM S10712]|uniref:carotenoid biosynthesis protein n=1 Tax=Yinghuangia sp. YIM S10712 TaxID=3436930 RepID=UPI003F5306E2
MTTAPAGPPETLGRPRAGAWTWALTGAAVGLQMITPLWPETGRDRLTQGTVLTCCAASVLAAWSRHGARGAAAVLGVCAVGGWAVEAAGLRTGFPFGTYTYGGGLGPDVAQVPVLVPLAWAMMAYPSLVVGRTLARPGADRCGTWAVGAVGGWALASWDVFLDPRMVDEGHWSWADPRPALPGVPGVPLTNYAGWLAVAVAMVAALHRLLPEDTTHTGAPQGPPAALYLWTYASSAMAGALFFDRPGAALAGGVLMGLTALPFALRTVRALRDRTAPAAQGRPRTPA